MKEKLHKLGLGLAASVMLCAALPAHAINKYGCIYAVDPWDHIVKDPYGRCIRTPWWTPEKDVPECGGQVAVEPAPAQCEKITLGTDTLFDFDRSEVKPRGRARLDQLASDINQASKVSTVKIVGHTDSKGTDAYNMRLGQRRADAVASYLVSRSVQAGKLRTSSMGESQPVAPNTLPNGKDNPEGRAQNRRVEITTVTETCRE
ncbi:MAG TPA: OmpA family protein [Candidatus Competibacter sp.]|nr:OmpA family protein [Candidatus Competibacter sp.]MCC9004552.1 OmpA family protein [Candidatus Competibacter sp.]HRF63782.1 OmpA family protein [Candidatus Competibacter sp.]HRX62400.1 OmpA family protein [Candidatus Competibacter sp.]HUM89974.1 OmpA family protein [Candidatus Competibacter sp.]